MFTAIRMMAHDPKGRLILIWAVVQVLVGTLVYRWLEGWSVVDSVYFSVVTLATVGFGDLHPTSDVTKIFTIFYIVMGLGVLTAFITEVTHQRSLLLERLRQHEGARKHHDAADPDDAVG